MFSLKMISSIIGFNILLLLLIQVETSDGRSVYRRAEEPIEWSPRGRDRFRDTFDEYGEGETEVGQGLPRVARRNFVEDFGIELRRKRPIRSYERDFAARGRQIYRRRANRSPRRRRRQGLRFFGSQFLNFAEESNTYEPEVNYYSSEGYEFTYTTTAPKQAVQLEFEKEGAERGGERGQQSNGGRKIKKRE